MSSVINLSINNSTDQTQMKSKHVKTWIRTVKTSKQSQLCCCGRDGMNAAGQPRTTPKYPAGTLKLKQAQGAMRHRERPFQVLSYCWFQSFPGFSCYTGGLCSSFNVMAWACPEVEESIFRKKKKKENSMLTNHVYPN